MAYAAARALRRGQVRTATLGLVVDIANLVEYRAASALPARYCCPCCGHRAHAFRHHMAAGRVSWHSACPRCDSRSRHRGLAILLPQLLAEHEPDRVLHFAPEPVLRRYLETPQTRYETADLHLDDVTHRNVDLETLPFPAGSYDLLVCNHVLEHVPDDESALRELARVVNADGAVLITVPGNFRQHATRHFSGVLENGHYRDYGTDLVDRLSAYFTRVDTHDLHDLDRDPTGLSRAIRPGDLAFVCRSPRQRS